MTDSREQPRLRDAQLLWEQHAETVDYLRREVWPHHHQAAVDRELETGQFLMELNKLGVSLADAVGTPPQNEGDPAPNEPGDPAY